MQKIYSIVMFIFSGCIVFAADGHLSNSEIRSLSLEELLNVNVKTGTFTDVTQSKIPASITTIYSEQIRTTPARNILDLIEIYVPGATFVNHWLGPRLGIGGVLGDQNTSFVMLVDGEYANMQTMNGPFFEIQNRDLCDIEKIEIIRGPGSLKYGSGAIGGVINIITHSASSSPGLSFSAQLNLGYRFDNFNISYGTEGDEFDLYLFAGLSKSRGIANPDFYYVDRAHGYGYGYMSDTWGNRNLGTDAPNFYEDFWDKPQLKLNLNLGFLNDFRLRARLTTISFTKQQQETATADGPAHPGLYGKQFMTSLAYQPTLNEIFELSSSVHYQSQSHRDINFYQGTNEKFDHITQRSYSFSENMFTLKSLLNITASQDYKFAVGGEYRYTYLGPEWGMTDEDFVLGFQPPMRFVILDSNSGFYKLYNPAGFCTFIDETIDGNLLSLFGEANLTFHPDLTLLLSGRFDKHTYAKWAISPRLALMYSFDSDNMLKFIAQQSVRLPALINLFSEDYISGTQAEPEKLRGLELIFSHLHGEHIHINMSGHHQIIDQIAWQPEGKAGPVGKINQAGLDFEFLYHDVNIKYGLRYSYNHQIDWEPVSSDSAWLSNIGPDSVNIILPDYGANRMNNLPNHMIKLFADFNVIDDLHIHVDGRLFTKYNQIEMMDKFLNAHKKYGTQETIDEMQAIYNDMADKGYAKPSFTSNASLSYGIEAFSSDIELSIYAMNLISVNHIRYVFQFWEMTDNRQYPRHAGFIEEPLVVGASIRINY